MEEINERDRFYEIAVAMQVFARDLADGFASENPAERAAALDEFIKQVEIDAQDCSGVTWFTLAVLALALRHVPAFAQEFGRLAQAALDAWGNDKV